METGGFLLGEGSESRLLALPSLTGATRRRDLFAVSAEALAQLFEWAAHREHAIHAQFHSHRRKAFLSSTDLTHGFNVEGFTTCVVPTYASPPAEPAAWGWWRYEDGGWADADAPEVAPGDCEVVTFDADGVYA